MKNFNVFVLLVFLLILSLDSFSQSLDNFNDVLKAKAINKTVTKKVGKDISQRTFLGTTKDSLGHIRYYVVKEFLRIQAAVVFHGHSRILFFNTRNLLVKESILSLPNELPIKLKLNSLYFNYLHNGVVKIFIQDITTLPRMICVEPTSCYEVSNPS